MNRLALIVTALAVLFGGIAIDTAVSEPAPAAATDPGDSSHDGEKYYGSAVVHSPHNASWCWAFFKNSFYIIDKTSIECKAANNGYKAKARFFGYLFQPIHPHLRYG